MTKPLSNLRRYGQADLDDVRPLLVSIYAEVYADVLHDPFFSVERFDKRLDGQASSPGWEAVVGYTEDDAIGYAYGSPMPPATRWWSRADPPLDPAFTNETGDRTFALFELMVRQPWRGTGAAHLIHDELLRLRPEQRVALLVEEEHPKVRALYERWGYQRVARDQPTADAPAYDMMVRPLGTEAH
jgi:GNAT superfamily N-acetyltransferase